MSTTAIDLNNEGVLYLDAGEYEKAAYSFKEASKLILTLVAKELPVAMAAAEVEARRTTKSAPQSAPFKRKAEYVPSEPSEKKRKVQMQPQARQFSSQVRPRKRTRTSRVVTRSVSRAAKATSSPPTSSTTTAAANVSGRPLWMKKPAPGKKGFRATTEAAIILYNLGLTFHLNSARVEKLRSRQWMCRRALDLYNMAKELILGSPAAHAFESPVFLVALHNIGNVYRELGEMKRVGTTQKEIAAVLRLLRASNLVGLVNDRGYEGFYLKLLSLPPSNQLAAAA